MDCILNILLSLVVTLSVASSWLIVKARGAPTCPADHFFQGSGEGACVRCMSCNQSSLAAEPCGATSDTQCINCVDDVTQKLVNDPRCRRCKPCQPGYRLTKMCTEDSRRKCERCPKGTFNERLSYSSVCLPCTRKQNRVQLVKCSVKHNAAYGPCKRGYYEDPGTKTCLECRPCQGELYARELQCKGPRKCGQNVAVYGRTELLFMGNSGNDSGKEAPTTLPLSETKEPAGEGKEKSTNGHFVWRQTLIVLVVCLSTAALVVMALAIILIHRSLCSKFRERIKETPVDQINTSGQQTNRSGSKKDSVSEGIGLSNPSIDSEESIKALVRSKDNGKDHRRSELSIREPNTDSRSDGLCIESPRRVTLSVVRKFWYWISEGETLPNTSTGRKMQAFSRHGSTKSKSTTDSNQSAAETIETQLSRTTHFTLNTHTAVKCDDATTQSNAKQLSSKIGSVDSCISIYDDSWSNCNSSLKLNTCSSLWLHKQKEGTSEPLLPRETHSNASSPTPLTLPLPEELSQDRQSSENELHGSQLDSPYPQPLEPPPPLPPNVSPDDTQPPEVPPRPVQVAMNVAPSLANSDMTDLKPEETVFSTWPRHTPKTSLGTDLSTDFSVAHEGESTEEPFRARTKSNEFPIRTVWNIGHKHVSIAS